jgi:hypothetical protein
VTGSWAWMVVSTAMVELGTDYTVFLRVYLYYHSYWKRYAHGRAAAPAVVRYAYHPSVVT